MKKVAKISFVIIGTMIGAGFASGQEIALFFYQYGMKGIWGIFLSCILTGIIIAKVFGIVHSKNIQNYTEFLEEITKNKKIASIIKIIVQLFLLISFYIMVAGFCAYFQQEWKIPVWISAVGISFLVYETFQKNKNGIVLINTFLIPILIIFIYYLGIKNFSFIVGYWKAENVLPIIENVPFSWLFSSIIYASYNSITLIPILIELSTDMDNKQMIQKISVLCIILLISLGLILFTLLLRGEGYIAELELPILQIVKEFGKIYPIIYGGVIITAIFTSAVSAGYGFLKNATTNAKTYDYLTIFLCLSSLFVAPIGFSNLVNLWYPFFGILGIFQIFYLFRKKKGAFERKEIELCIEKTNKN